MANQTNYTGLWIPINILADEKLSDKEKMILSMIIFQSSNNNECTTSNQSFTNIFNISTNRVSKIISALKDKKYIEVNFSYKENGKEIMKRTLIPIVKNNNTPVVINDNKYSQNEQQPIGENDKVIKYNKKIYNNFGKNNNRSKSTYANYEQREYPVDFWEQFYANMPKKTVSTNTT